jgi:hypothetical protein
MKDMLTLLRVLITYDPLTVGDVWRDQSFVELINLSVSAEDLELIGKLTAFQGR